MHGHDQLAESTNEVASISGVGGFLMLLGIVAFMMGLLPIPVGYKRGKIKWLMWCGTGMHAHIVYWHGDDGFQTIHPEGIDD